MRAWLQRNAGVLAFNVVFTAVLLAFSYGCWLERPSLGWIVPSACVGGLMIYGRLRMGKGKE